MRPGFAEDSDPRLEPISVARGVPMSFGSGVDVAIAQISSKGVVFYVNSPMAQLLGRAKSELEMKHVKEIDTFPWGPGLLHLALARMREEGQPFEITRSEILPETGETRHWRIAVHPLEGSRAQVSVQDVTRYQKLRRIFARFVSPEVLDLMLSTPERDFLRPERRVLSVLFGDLRGFTGLAARADPLEVRRLLGAFHGRMIPAIKGHRGTIDKIIGDGVMALFGAPVESGSHAKDALEAAGAMQVEHEPLLAAWRSEGLDPPGLGIGIATGEVVVGNVGADDSFVNYTAVGHTVNLAARICENAQAGEILLSVETARSALAVPEEQAGASLPSIRKMGSIRMKNIPEPVDVARLEWREGQNR